MLPDRTLRNKLLHQPGFYIMKIFYTILFIFLYCSSAQAMDSPQWVYQQHIKMLSDREKINVFVFLGALCATKELPKTKKLFVSLLLSQYSAALVYRHTYVRTLHRLSEIAEQRNRRDQLSRQIGLLQCELNGLTRMVCAAPLVGMGPYLLLRNASLSHDKALDVGLAIGTAAMLAAGKRHVNYMEGQLYALTQAIA